MTHEIPQHCFFSLRLSLDDEMSYHRMMKWRSCGVCHYHINCHGHESVYHCNQGGGWGGGGGGGDKVSKSCDQEGSFHTLAGKLECVISTRGAIQLPFPGELFVR